MEAKALKPYQDWFENHILTHKVKAPDRADLMDRKYRHTMRVLDHVREIIKESGASAEMQEAMEVAALLHDTGRFPQLVESPLCDYKAGKDHGDVGARLLSESDLLVGLPLDIRGIVLSAVKFHNNSIIPANLGPDATLVLSVVRDADKLDAIRNNLKYQKPDALYGKAKKCGITWHDTEVTPEVFSLAMNRELIPMPSMKWSNDFILFLCCWIYELGFHYSFKYLKESGLYRDLLDRLPDNSQFAPLKEQLWGDLEWIGARSKPIGI